MNNHWLKNRRRELMISQDDLAARLQLAGQDISRGTISHWERGRNEIPLNDPVFTRGLARALELPLIDMFYRAGYIDSNALSEEANRAAAIVEAMTPDRKRTALAVLEQLSKE